MSIRLPEIALGETNRSSPPAMGMEWLPPAPDDFRERLRRARSLSNPSERLENFVQLAQHRLSFIETIQLDRALAESTTEAWANLTRVRLAFLAASTIDHLLPPVRVAGLRRRMLIETYKGAYGQYRQQLMDPASTLYEFHPEVVLFAQNVQQAISAIPLEATANEAGQAVSRAVAELRELWRLARKNFASTVIQQTFLDVSEPVFGNYDRLVPGTPAYVVGRLNDMLASAASEEEVLLLDVARASARDGMEAWFDIARWLQGKIEIAPSSAERYGELVARLIAAQKGLSKKCLVLDLDNTLWGGVVGDDGLEGIVLGEGSAQGEAHLQLQRYAKRLKERGVILAVCSKNDPAIAEAAFRDHPEMILRRSDIAAFRANWNDKAENLRTIAEQLNIGLDSLVFVDDNPIERARVRESLPMVAVPELPADAAHYVRCIANAGYFEAIAFTNEDRNRSIQYTANAEREALCTLAKSMDEFLAGLEMSVVFGPVSKIDLARVTQLINKTNQFNTTTRRYSGEDVAKLIAIPCTMALQFRLIDRFGDNGIVSVIILRPLPGESEVFDIATWVMSCRVFGRQLEVEIMKIVVEALKAQGARELRGQYIPTTKNGVISQLYESLGFSRFQQREAPDGSTWWRLILADYCTQHTFISRRTQ